MNIKNNLDNRICDCEYGADNTETYREYLFNTLNEFNIEKVDIDTLSNEELKQCLNFCNELWVS